MTKRPQHKKERRKRGTYVVNLMGDKLVNDLLHDKYWIKGLNQQAKVCYLFIFKYGRV